MFTDPLDRKLRLSGIILILGLLVEALCLLGHGPIAFILFVCLGGLLFAVGVLLYLYSLVSAKTESSNGFLDRRLWCNHRKNRGAESSR
jgi:hypothetical protein